MSNQKPYNMITEGGELIQSIHLAKEGILMQHRTKLTKVPMLQLLIKHMCGEVITQNSKRAQVLTGKSGPLT